MSTLGLAAITAQARDLFLEQVGPSQQVGPSLATERQVEVACQLCKAQFSRVRRKHRCSSCEKAVCVKCSRQVRCVPRAGGVGSGSMGGADSGSAGPAWRVSHAAEGRYRVCSRCFSSTIYHREKKALGSDVALGLAAQGTVVEENAAEERAAQVQEAAQEKAAKEAAAQEKAAKETAAREKVKAAIAGGSEEGGDILGLDHDLTHFNFNHVSPAAPRSKSKLTIDDFELLHVLGRGAFGKVMMVRHRATGAAYAIKVPSWYSTTAPTPTAPPTPSRSSAGAL